MSIPAPPVKFIEDNRYTIAPILYTTPKDIAKWAETNGSYAAYRGGILRGWEQQLNDRVQYLTDMMKKTPIRMNEHVQNIDRFKTGVALFNALKDAHTAAVNAQKAYVATLWKITRLVYGTLAFFASVLSYVAPTYFAPALKVAPSPVEFDPNALYDQPIVVTGSNGERIEVRLEQEGTVLVELGNSEVLATLRLQTSSSNVPKWDMKQIKEVFKGKLPEKENVTARLVHAELLSAQGSPSFDFALQKAAQLAYEIFCQSPEYALFFLTTPDFDNQKIPEFENKFIKLEGNQFLSAFCKNSGLKDSWVPQSTKGKEVAIAIGRSDHKSQKIRQNLVETPILPKETLPLLPPA